MKNCAVLAAALALASGAAVADDNRLSYDYLELRYAESEVEINDGFDDFDVEGDGFVLNGLVEVGGAFHLFASYDRLEFDDNVDVSTTVYGGGFNFSITPRTDLVLRLGFADARFETPFFEDEDDGVFTSVGIRTMVHEDIELYGSLASLDLDNAADEEIATLGLDFFLTDSLALGPWVQVIDDTTTWTIGAKVYF